jgi:hypothetical protein
MHQAIEEGFIIDVLAGYTTCQTDHVWRHWAGGNVDHEVALARSRKCRDGCAADLENRLDSAKAH